MTNLRLLVLAALFVIGCAGTDEVSVRILAPDGSEQVHTGTLADVAGNEGPLVPLRADGELIYDPAVLFTATQIELRDPQGNWFSVTRDGNELTADTGLALTWDAERGQLAAHLPDGELAMYLDGISDPHARARVLGRLALGVLGADTGSETKSDGGLTIVIIAIAVSYISCLSGGELLCSQSASRGCRSGVKDYKTVCGAGYDVAGEFRLGFRARLRASRTP